MNETAIKRIRAAKAKGSTALNLSELALETLPDALWDLRQLKMPKLPLEPVFSLQLTIGIALA